MDSIVFGYTSVTVGALYLVLAAQVLRELRSSEGPLGYGFIAAFTTCALHHLIHAHHLLAGDVPADLPEGVSMVASIVPAAIYVRFRFNAAVGRPADFELDGLPSSAFGLLLASAAGGGGFMAWVAIRAADRAGAVDPWAVWPGLAIFAAYMTVGYLLSLTQLQRYRTEGVISTSAVAFTGIFFTCAVSHYAYAFGRVETDWHSAGSDLLGVFGSWTFVAIVVWLRRTHHRRYASMVGGSRVRETKVAAPWVGAR